jgi:hypothetical protein
MKGFAVVHLEAFTGIMHQAVCYAFEPHFRVGFRPKKLLEQPQSPQNDTISQSTMQVIGQWDQYEDTHSTTRLFKEQRQTSQRKHWAFSHKDW